MKFSLDPAAGTAQSRDTLSSAFASLALPQASAQQLSGDFGTVISQVLRADGFEVWQHHFLIEEPVLLHPVVSKGTYSLTYMCSGNVPCEMEGTGLMTLRQDRYKLYYLPAEVRQSAWFDPGVYRCVQISLPDDTINNLADEYPQVREALQEQTIPSEHGALPEPFKIDFNIRSLLRDILNCQAGGFSRDLFLKARIMDLLLIYVRDLLREQKDLFGMDERLLREIGEYLLNNLQQPLTIANLARHFGTNQVSLRRHFKAYFKMPIHHFLVRHRMEKAQALLREQLSVHQVAPMIGYADASSFSRAFSAYFGESPSSYRNNPSTLNPEWSV